MQILIDIDEGKYNWIMSHASKNPRDYADAGDLFFRTAVEHGIVIPKGHGDLIDRDSLNSVAKANYMPTRNLSYNDLDNAENFNYGVTSVLDDINCSKVIIPADK